MNLILKSSNSMKKVKPYNERHNKKENGIFDHIYPLWAATKEERPNDNLTSVSDGLRKE